MIFRILFFILKIIMIFTVICSASECEDKPCSFKKCETGGPPKPPQVDKSKDCCPVCV
ncbi:unnamed protein product [Larinioides sclopetarius]|uniref:Uncharacterized protein n=1 Tax=Larinioides sclopetarius TaxID=280406 RepID=A0AAV1ZZM5_9ARAC